MVLYVKYFIMQLKSQMQYKTSFFLAIIGQFLTAFTSFWGISFIFNNVSSVDQFTYEEVLLCFAVVMMSFSIGEMFGGGLSVFPRLMRNGSFDRILTRPRSIIFQVLAGNTDFARIGLIVQALVVLIYAVNKSQNSWTFLKICTLILMISCGSIVFKQRRIRELCFGFFFQIQSPAVSGCNAIINKVIFSAESRIAGIFNRAVIHIGKSCIDSLKNS